MRQDQDDFDRAPSKAVLPSRFISHSRRYYVTSAALAHGIPMTGVSQSHGQRSIEVTDGIYLHLMPTAWDQARTVSMRHTWTRQPRTALSRTRRRLTRITPPPLWVLAAILDFLGVARAVGRPAGIAVTGLRVGDVAARRGPVTGHFTMATERPAASATCGCV